ncbi:hypothetical protein HAX54_014596 [Datura stramonium]|uniref:Aminotransferase-like plant mobile domain-containing protein n=1 Tax=Datura stramonium TaxID=4076 RepID=A0ABS8RYY9_DATST|nr:hypothetical protein [Datura stramonium]
MVGGVRIGRWHDVKQSGVINVRTTIDSSGDIFRWRPYALGVEGWMIPKFYNEKKEWAIVEGQNLDQELESFIRCVRVSELVGLDYQEPYRPNRVAMQFGYDQDFPKRIPRSPSSPKVSWCNYSRPIDSELRFYYPPRLFELDVTMQYLKRWRKEVLFLADAFKGLSRGRRSLALTCLKMLPFRIMLDLSCEMEFEVEFDYVFPNFNKFYAGGGRWEEIDTKVEWDEGATWGGVAYDEWAQLEKSITNGTDGEESTGCVVDGEFEEDSTRMVPGGELRASRVEEDVEEG